MDDVISMEIPSSSSIFCDKFQINNVKIGGIKSEIPTVLIASIFYMRHKIVKNESEGIFDEEAARRLICHCCEIAERLGIGFMLDVIGTTPQALVRYVRFIKEVSDVPVLINSTTAEVRISALKQLAEADQLQGVVYNSINSFGTDEEMDILSKLPVEAAVIQAYSIKSKKPDGPLKSIIGSKNSKGLMDKILKSGIKNIMVDIPILDLSSVGTIGYSARLIKNALGVPVGTAPANATYTSEWLRNRSNVSLEQFRMLNATVASYLAANDCNFLFFGPIEGADWVFPACALTDAMNVYGARHLGINPCDENHSIYKLM